MTTKPNAPAALLRELWHALSAQPDRWNNPRIAGAVEAAQRHCDEIEMLLDDLVPPDPEEFVVVEDGDVIFASVSLSAAGEIMRQSPGSRLYQLVRVREATEVPA